MKQQSHLLRETKCKADLWQTLILTLLSSRIDNTSGKQRNSFIKLNQKEAVIRIEMDGMVGRSRATMFLQIKATQGGGWGIFWRRKAVSLYISWDRDLCSSHQIFLCSLQITIILMWTCNRSASARSRCLRANSWWRFSLCNRCQDMSSSNGHEMLPTVKPKHSKGRIAVSIMTITWASHSMQLRNHLCS